MKQKRYIRNIWNEAESDRSGFESDPSDKTRKNIEDIEDIDDIEILRNVNFLSQIMEKSMG